MSTPVSSLLKLNYLLSYIFKLGGTVSIFTRPVMLAVCVEVGGGGGVARRGSETRLRGNSVTDFFSVEDLQANPSGISVHILGDLQSDFPSDKHIYLH